MPNNTSNLITFYGLPEQIAAVKAALGTPEQPIDFTYIEPYPERFRQMDAECPDYFDPERESKLAVYSAKWGTTHDGFNAGGYEWRLEHWGTKWNAYKIRVERDYEYAYEVRLQTAWSWPEKFVRKVLAEFPGLTVTFISGCEGGFFGVYISRDDDGELTERIWNGRMMGREHHIIIAALSDALASYATPTN